MMRMKTIQYGFNNDGVYARVGDRIAYSYCLYCSRL